MTRKEKDPREHQLSQRRRCDQLGRTAGSVMSMRDIPRACRNDRPGPREPVPAFEENRLCYQARDQLIELHFRNP